MYHSPCFVLIDTIREPHIIIKDCPETYSTISSIAINIVIIY